MASRGRILLGAALGVLGLATVAAGATALAGAVLARRVVTPPLRREQDVRILGVDLAAATIDLSVTDDTRIPGEYSLWFSRETGHARVGEILHLDDRVVRRRILGVDRGDLEAARRGRLTGWVYLTPADLGVPFEEVEVATPVGPAPAWFIPAAGPSRGRFAIHVHGRAVRRPETLRAVPIFREAGFDSLVISYRNDGEAPRSDDHRYALGDREWEDVDAAITAAVERGAREIVLVGWSMGGATVLQALTRSARADLISAVVLESPVVDWVTALDFHVRLRRLPGIVRRLVLLLYTKPWGRVVTGLAEPLDIPRLDFVTRARELDRPILILHSDDDGFVPSTASRALAVARPDIVRFVGFRIARHTKLWNLEPARWEGAIRAFLADLPRR